MIKINHRHQIAGLRQVIGIDLQFLCIPDQDAGKIQATGITGYNLIVVLI